VEAMDGVELINAKVIERHPEMVLMKCIDENLDLNGIRKYYTLAGWQALLCTVKNVTQKGVWRCRM